MQINGIIPKQKPIASIFRDADFDRLFFGGDVREISLAKMAQLVIILGLN